MEWTWTWHPHPDVWLLVAALFVGYGLAVRRLGPRLAPAGRPAATRGEVIWFVAGVLTLWAASDWPIHDLAEGSLYSVHMVQHMLMSFVAAPMLLLGTPAWLARWLLRTTGLLRVARQLARPLPALVIFNTMIVVTHWPMLVNHAVGNELLHFTMHAALFISALIMWMPVASPLIEVPRLSYPGQMGYLFLHSLVPTIPASFLTFGDAPLYRAYEALPKIWGLTPLEDQRLAGLIMKIGGGFLLWGVVTVLFFKWYAAEQSGADMLSHRDLDRHLNRTELAKP